MTSLAPDVRNSSHIGPPAELAPVIAKYHFYNDLIAGCISLTINLLLIFVVTTRISTTTKAFKILMTMTKAVEILFSTCLILTAPIFTSIVIQPSFSGLLIVNTGWQFNFLSSQIFLSAALVFLTQQIFLSPWMYYFRYLQVCGKNGINFSNIILIISINLILQTLTALFLSYSAFPTDDDISFLKATADSFTGVTSAFLFLSYTKSTLTTIERLNQIASIISAISYLISLLISIFIMIFCSLKMNMKVRESRNTSNNLLVIQRKMNRVLLTQFFCPLIFIQLPFYYSVLGPIFGLFQGLVTDLLPLLFAWSPVINTLAVFLLNADIRNALIGKQRVASTSNPPRSNG